MHPGASGSAGPLFYALAALAFAIAAWGAARRLAGWRGARLGAEDRDVRALFLEILLARRLRRISHGRSLLHACLMWGIVVLFLVGSLGDWLIEKGIVPGSKDTPWFAFVNNLAGALVLLAAAASLGRRVLFASPEGRLTREDGVLYSLLIGILLTGYAVQAARHAEVARTAYLAIWWIHAALALVGIAIAPFTRIFHVLATPATLATGGRGSMFAALDGCTQCGECTRACEAYGARPDPAIAPSVRMREVGRLLRQERAPSALERWAGGPPPSGEALAALGQGTFHCTTCARCTPTCPAGIDLVPLWKLLRANMTGRGLYPRALDKARQAVRETRNVLKYPNDDRALWVDFLDDPPDDSFRREKAEILYFVGCMSSFSPAVQSIPQAFAQVLTRLGSDFTILGADEACCGFPMIVAGMPGEVEELKRSNVERVRAAGAKNVVFTCPSCFHTWRTIYGPELPGVRMLHATQFLAEALPRSGLALRPPQAGRRAVTYHDPCDLGRNSGVYDEPRRVLEMLPGVELREAAETKEAGRCCGGGGDLEISDADLVHLIARRTAAILAAPGSPILATACPQCKRILAPEAARLGMEALDVAELAWLSLGGDLT